ncbi:hypothetical protein KW798_00235 [Candidatus Parcubacteria bacterium]|nr:hypothetical protein [Candidatus Parcubacteria bacterium]
MSRNLHKIVVGGFASILFLSASVASASTIVVTGNTSPAENQPGWMFNRDTTTSNPFEFNNNKHSIGTGSLYVFPIGATSSNKFIAENFINAPIADVNSVSYDFFIGSGGDLSDKDQFYMNVYANFGVSDDLKFYDCRYAVLPPTGSTTAFTTVTFDPTVAYQVTTRGGATPSPFACPAVPADMDLMSSSSNIRMFSVSVGDTSASDVGLDGYLDRVVVNRDSNGETVYDFERDVPPPPTPASPTTQSQCKNNGWQAYGFKNQGQCVRYIETGKDSRVASASSIGSFFGSIFSWFADGISLVASTIVPGKQKQMEKNINNIDADANGYPDVGKEVNGKYTSVYAYDATDNWYWDLGDGRINGTVTSISLLDSATLTTCNYQVEYRGAFNNDPFLDSGWIINNIKCSGYDDNNAYNYLIVHETDPRYRGNPDWAVWGTWEYKTNTQSGFGNFVRPIKHTNN